MPKLLIEGDRQRIDVVRKRFGSYVKFTEVDERPVAAMPPEVTPPPPPPPAGDPLKDVPAKEEKPKQSQKKK